MGARERAREGERRAEGVGREGREGKKEREEDNFKKGNTIFQIDLVSLTSNRMRCLSFFPF